MKYIIEKLVTYSVTVLNNFLTVIALAFSINFYTEEKTQYQNLVIFAFLD